MFAVIFTDQLPLVADGLVSEAVDNQVGVGHGRAFMGRRRLETGD